jgi:hypothetical protein
LSLTLTPGEMLRRRATEATIARAEGVPRWSPVGKLLAPLTDGAPVVFCELSSRLLGGYRPQDGAIVLNAGGFGVGPDDLWADDNDQARVYAALEGILSRASFARRLALSGAQVPDIADHIASAVIDVSGSLADKEGKESFRRAGLADLRALTSLPTWLRSAGLLAANAAIRRQAGLLTREEADPIIRLALELLPKQAAAEFRALVKAGAQGDAAEAVELSIALQSLIAAHDRALDAQERVAYHEAYRHLVAALQNAEPPSDSVLARYGAIVKHLIDQGVAHGVPALRALLFGVDLGPVGMGVEQSHFAADKSGDEWIVKGHGGRGTLCFTEALSSLLAQAIGVLTPTSGAMTNGQEVLFASRRVAIVHPKGKEKLSKKDAAGISVLDPWITNTDRHQGNIVIEQQGQEYRIWAIDHGHSLAGLLQPAQGGHDHYIEAPAHCADSVCGVRVDKAEQAKILKRLRTVSEDQVRAMVRRMPPAWRKSVPTAALAELPARVVKRAQMVAQVARG